MEILLVISGLAFFFVVLNSFTIRVVKDNPTTIIGSVSILIPMRNEASNVRECLASALNQVGLEKFEVLALDDNSTDITASEIKSFPKVKFILGSSLPDGWLGKLWACHQLANKSDGEYLVFLDADVRLSRNAIASAISKMRNWDFISPYPRQLTTGFVQKIFQPLLQWSWLVSIPIFLAQRFSVKSMVVANGQFLIVKRDAYFQSDGHSSVKNEVLDDLMLAKTLLGNGFSGGVAEASQVATCHMYKSRNELFRGYQKSLWKAFGSLPATLVAISLLTLTGLIPLLTALTGSTIGFIAFGLITFSRIIASLRTSSLPNTAILHPIAIILLIGLIMYSWFGKLTKSLTWRERSVV